MINYELKDSEKRMNAGHIFTGTFDYTWHTDPKLHGQREFTIIPPETLHGIKDDGAVYYKYNSEHFRSDEFSKNHDGFHILFAGCSQTEGVGGNIEDNWTKILYNKLQNNGNILSGYYNIAKSGFGWQSIIHNAIVYFNKYGFPDYLLVLLPNFCRYFEWIEESRHYRYSQKYIKGENSEVIATEKEYFEQLINFHISWKLFEEYCKTNNVKLVWTTWLYFDANNIDNNTFKDTMFKIDEKELQSYIRQQYESGREPKPDDIKRRDNHDGTMINEFWANCFYNFINQKYGII